MLLRVLCYFLKMLQIHIKIMSFIFYRRSGNFCFIIQILRASDFDKNESNYFQSLMKLIFKCLTENCMNMKEIKIRFLKLRTKNHLITRILLVMVIPILYR